MPALRLGMAPTAAKVCADEFTSATKDGQARMRQRVEGLLDPCHTLRIILPYG